MKQPNDTEDFATLMLEDLRGAMTKPGFHPGLVILLLSLPGMNTRDCRALPIETAFDLLDDLRVKAGLPVERIDAIKRQVDEVRAKLMTATVTIWAREDAFSIWVEGIVITAAAKA